MNYRDLSWRELSKKQLAAKTLIAIAGLFVMAQGVSIYLMTGMGVDPISVFVDGLTKHFPITFGVSQTILNVAILIIPIIFFRKFIGVSTLLAMVLLGPFFDLIMHFESAFISPALDITVKVPLMAVGQILFSLGIAIYLSTNMGGSPCDTPGVIISKKMKWKYGYVRLGSDAVFFITGLLLGGAVGLGTAVCVLVTGPLAQVFLPRFMKLNRRIDSKSLISYLDKES